jgi:hypothetical protein
VSGDIRKKCGVESGLTTFDSVGGAAAKAQDAHGRDQGDRDVGGRLIEVLQNLSVSVKLCARDAPIEIYA